MGTAEITELIRDALVARGFLGLEEAECVYVRKDLGGKPHIEAAGLTANASERFLAAMEEMGYAPDSYKTLSQ
jgi:hypothetical protein